MCDWCKENDGEPIGCQDCGVMLCWDITGFDDVLSQPYVTSYGDVYCLRCGRRNQQAIEDMEEEEAEEYGWDYPYSWYDSDLDFEEEDATGLYIGPREDED